MLGWHKFYIRFVSADVQTLLTGAMTEVHIYPSLCEQLGTEYKIAKNDNFTKILDLNNDDYGVGARLKSIALQNQALRELLVNKSSIGLVQKPDTYGWFRVEDASTWE